jgi:hypothetical protein
MLHLARLEGTPETVLAAEMRRARAMAGVACQSA